jgi:hypothetical protein
LRFVVDRPVPGGNRRRRVDILLRGARVAGFVDGCFWHSCPEHSHLPKTNTSWRRLKFRGIARRDRDTDTELAAAGWLAVRIWEHEGHWARQGIVSRGPRRRAPFTAAPRVPAGASIPPTRRGKWDRVAVRILLGAVHRAQLAELALQVLADRVAVPAGHDRRAHRAVAAEVHRAGDPGSPSRRHCRDPPRLKIKLSRTI